MKCMNCPLKPEHWTLVSPNGDDELIDLYECPFGDHALHLHDHRCSKFKKRKEAELIQNEEVKL